MKPRFLTRAELIALAAVFMTAHRGECLLDPSDELDAPEDLRGWLDLGDLSARYGIAQGEIMAGLRDHAAKGVIRLAVDPDNPAAVYVEALRDPRMERGWRPWDVRFGVRLVTEKGFRPVAL